MREGYQVVEAPDGAAALEIASSGRIDLALLDVLMPRMTGLEVCRALRGDPALLHLPVVFLTGLHDRASRILAKDAGADDLLTKPVDDLEVLVRVKSLLRLKTAFDAREKQRLLMTAILDSMNEGVVAVDEASGFTLWNQAAERILGPAQQWQSVPGWPGPHHPVTGGRAHPSTGSPLARAMAGEPSVEERIVLDAEDAGSAGRHLAISARPMRGTRDSRGAVAVFRDVTDLVELDQFKLEMSSLVVHDLKNVMLIIGANLEHAIEIGHGDGELHDTLSDAEDAAARAIRLIANLMDVARLENSALALKADPIDAKALFVAATKHRTSQLRGKRIRLDLEADPEALIEGDFEVLQRVVDNVLDNAVRYTPAGGRISLAATRTSTGTVRLAIGNTGGSVPEPDRARIFQKYGQGGATAAGKMNTGLGLYFCHLAALAHDGKIWVESDPELPTLFVIELPSPVADVDAPTARRRLSIKLAM